MKFYRILKVGSGILGEALKELKSEFLGGKFLVFTGDEGSLRYGEKVAEVLDGDLVIGDSLPPDTPYDAIVGVGGGSVIDRAKEWAFIRSLPFISIPTLISSDGIASPVAVLDGKSRFLRLPFGIIVELEIIALAPRWSFLAGVGDLVSNLSASYDWDRFRSFSKEPYVAEASMLAKVSAMSVVGVDPLHNPAPLTWGLILSGVAMNLAGSSRPASGPEHKISHALDRIGYGQKHGIQVGIFTPLFLKLNGYPNWHKVREYLIGIGLPPSVRLKEEKAVEVFRSASLTRPHRYTVLERLGWERVLREAVELGFVELV